MAIDPADRPTLRDYARGAGAQFGCPRCGCRDWRVSNTYWGKIDAAVRRRRVCRHCNHPITTVEVIETDDGNSQ